MDFQPLTLGRILLSNEDYSRNKIHDLIEINLIVKSFTRKRKYQKLTAKWKEKKNKSALWYVSIIKRKIKLKTYIFYLYAVKIAWTIYNPRTPSILNHYAYLIFIPQVHHAWMEFFFSSKWICTLNFQFQRSVHFNQWCLLIFIRMIN